jgi:hypothetical protein
VKRSRLVEERRSSSRERRNHRSRRCRFARISMRAGCAASLATEGTSDRESARLSQGPRGTDLGGLRESAWESATAALRDELGGGDRGVRSGQRDDAVGKTTPRMQRSLGRRSGYRVVNRDAPRPRSHRMARATRCPFRASPDERGGARRKDVSRERARAARLGTSAAGERGCREAPLEHRSQRWETAKLGCSSLECFGVQKSVGRISFATPGSTQECSRNARTSSNESPKAQ